MRVLLASHTYTVGANRAKINALAEHANVDLRLVVPRSWPHPLGTFRADHQQQVHYALLPLSTLLAGNETRYIFFPDITGGLRTFRPDIIHIEQGPWALVHAQIILAKKVLAPRARVIFFTWLNQDYYLSRRARTVERFNFRNSDWAIAGNREGASLLRKHGFAHPVSVLPQTGVDPAIYRPTGSPALRAELQLNHGTNIGFAGRIEPEKGVETLLEAFASLDLTSSLIFIGDGSHRAVLAQKAAALQVADRVRFLGVVSHTEMPDYINLLDVLVLPSTTTAYWKEQFGRVLIEAMACGIPTVGSDSGEIPHVIGDAGLIFPEGDQDALSDILLRLLVNPLLRADLARRGRERVMQRFTNQRIAEDTYQIYCELLSRSTRHV
ncbi:MAG: glycosyltransferase family 4 protein [Chloroflexi bacterium]|nr:glycosyltransferase family 4 protein [Chloroflexota bacterium]